MLPRYQSPRSLSPHSHRKRSAIVHTTIHRARATSILTAAVVTIFLVYLFILDQPPSAAQVRRTSLRAELVRGGVSEVAGAGDAGRQQLPFVPPPVKQYPPTDPIPELAYEEDGLVRGWETRLGAMSESGRRASADHPILDLMERGRQRWDSLLARQSTSVKEAAETYVKRYNRTPPRGFDKWVQFCLANNVKIIDDYDQIEHDIGPWHGMAPSEFRKRVAELEDLPFSYQMTLRPNGTSKITGARAEQTRPLLTFGLLQGIADYLPEEIVFYGSDHDQGNWIMPDNFRAAALKAASKGEYLSTKDLNYYEDGKDHGMKPGLLASCSSKSLARHTMGLPAPKNENETTFVYNPTRRMDYCSTPELISTHGAFTFPMRRNPKLRPVFQLSKPQQNGEFVVTPLEGYRNATSKGGIEQTSEWSEKTISMLFWRGLATGDHYTVAKPGRPGYDWRKSHRTRLHLFAQRMDGNVPVWVKRENGWVQEDIPRLDLNTRYLDIGLVNKPVQCDKADGTCEVMANEIVFKDRVEPKAAKAYQYVIDVDGNGWSSRYHRLLASGSVVLKTTIYEEWMSDYLTPWVHYVPVNGDYSDIYNVMSFFVGPPDGDGPSHEMAAKTIAENARKFTLEHWRWEDMQAYMFRLLIEYQRLSYDDRDDASFWPEDASFTPMKLSHIVDDPEDEEVF